MPSASPGAIPVIPDYDLLRIVGQGSYGDVWLARGLTGVFRAIKIVWRHRFRDEHPYEREFSGLRDFARVSAREPHHVALLHVGRNDVAGFFYYVMELADDVATGREVDPNRYSPLTFKHYLDHGRRLPIGDVVSLAVDVARGLATLHAHGLVHRDIKPSNLILVEGRPKLADIGLVTSTRTAMTFVGTEGYVPPEGPGTPPADVYSLGKVLYELGTGCDRQEYPRLPTDLGVRPDRKQLLELNEVVVRACDPYPVNRYEDATSLLHDLLLLQAGKSVRRLRRTESGLRRARRAAAVLALAAVVASGGVYYERQRAQHEVAARQAAENERDRVVRQSFYAVSLAEAQRALDRGELGRARALLADLAPGAGEPDLRNFEWHVLMAEARGDDAEVLRDAGAAVTSLHLSPDQTCIAVGTAGAVVTLYDAASRRPLRTLQGVHRCAGFSPDGRTLFGTDPHFTVERWSVETGAADPAPNPSGVHRPLGVARSLPRLAYFADGSATEPHRLKIRDFDAGRDVAQWRVERQRDGEIWDFFRATVDAELRTALIVLIHGRRQLARWRWQLLDLQTGHVLYESEPTSRFNAVALSGDGQRFAYTRPNEDALVVGDARTGREHWRIPIGPRDGDLLSFDPSGTVVAVGGINATLTTYEVATGRLRGRWQGHNGGIAAVAWGPGKRLISGAAGGDVRWWRRSPLDTLAPGLLAGATTPAPDRQFPLLSEDGRRLGITTHDRAFHVYDLESLDEIAVRPDVALPLRLTADEDVWWVDGQAKVQHARATALTTDVATAVELFANGEVADGFVTDHAQRWFAATSRNGAILVYDMVQRRELRRFAPLGDRIFSLGLHSVANRLTAASDREMVVYDVTSGDVLARTTISNRHEFSCLSPDGRQLAVNVLPDQLHVRSLPDLRLLRTFPAGWTDYDAMVFSPDGSRLVFGDAAGLLHVYSTDDWRQVATFQLQRNEAGAMPESVFRVQFGPNGRSLVAMGETGRLRLWRW